MVIELFDYPFEEKAKGLLIQAKQDPDSSFRSDQLESIIKVTKDRNKLLLVKRTGWGKSMVYFIATKILSAMADTYNAINETTKIALISSLADTKNFQAYLDKQNALPQDWYTSEQVYQDMPQLLDPASVLYNMAQDKIMDEMIMMQYE